MRRSLKLPLATLLVVWSLYGCESKTGDGVKREGATNSTEGVASAETGPISVVAATFGKACGAPAGNSTPPVAQECNGKAQCSYFVTNPTTDPFPGCAKDFEVQYRCGKQTALRHVEHPAIAGENYPVDLSCR